MAERENSCDICEWCVKQQQGLLLTAAGNERTLTAFLAGISQTLIIIISANKFSHSRIIAHEANINFVCVEDVAGRHSSDYETAGDGQNKTLNRIPISEHVNVRKISESVASHMAIYYIDAFRPLFYVWGFTGSTEIYQLQKLQKRAARIITNSSFDAPSRPLIEGLGWKTIGELVIF